MKRLKDRANQKTTKQHFTVRGKNRLRYNLNVAETAINLQIHKDGYLMTDGILAYGLDKIKQIRSLINN